MSAPIGSPAGFYLKPTVTTRWPHRYGFLSVGGTVEVEGDRSVERFERAAWHHCSRREKSRPWRWSDPQVLRTLDEVWDTVDSWATPARANSHEGSEYWLIVRDSVRTLQLSDMFLRLADRGWRFERGVLNGDRTWAMFSCEKRKLILVDLMSWCAWSLPKLAAEVGHGGAWVDHLPANETEADLAIVAELAIITDVWHRIASWCESRNMGMARPTGAGQAMAAFQRNWLTENLLHHGDDEVYALERDAAWCGRAEAWRIGRVRGTKVHEWDMRNAYARIALDAMLPVHLMGVAPWRSVDEMIDRGAGFGHMCEVTVTTDRPCVPYRSPAGVVWPVGRFDTVLWQPEVELALAEGASIELRRVWAYRMVAALSTWAEWVLGALDEEHGEPDAIIRALVKRWSRALIGRFGMWVGDWEPTLTGGTMRIAGGPIVEHGVRYPRHFLVIGSQLWEEGTQHPSSRSVPSIMGWIQSECRVRLWRLMRQVGFEHLVHVDTDGVLVDDVAHEALTRSAGDDLRHKGSWDRAHVYRTRQVMLDKSARVSGMPYEGREVRGARWVGRAARTPLQSLSAGEPDRRVIRRISGTLGGHETKREVLPGGYTGPLTVWL